MRSGIGANPRYNSARRVMLIDSSIPGFPLRGMLQRFFRRDRSAPVHLDDVAELLGMTWEQVRAMAQRDDTLLRNGMLPWEEVAYQLFRLWPRVELLEMLGPDDDHHIPKLFFPAPLQLQVPLYLHLAMEHQAKRAWDEDERVKAQTFLRRVVPRGLHDYISDILHEYVDDRTIFAFRGNAAFLDAFHYPMDGS